MKKTKARTDDKITIGILPETRLHLAHLQLELLKLGIKGHPASNTRIIGMLVSDENALNVIKEKILSTDSSNIGV